MKKYRSFPFLPLLLLAFACSDGDDGDQGPPGSVPPNVINASQVSDDFLASLDVESEIVSAVVSGTPRVTFRLQTAGGIPITGIVPFWLASDRFVRFTLAKLVDDVPTRWVSYTRDAGTNAPDYDTGTSLVDHMDGTYTFTFATNVSSVAGVTYEPSLTHRVAGQIGSGSVSLEAQNMFLDLVPAGGAVTTTRNIVVMESCNECHANLVFHGRRFVNEYCVTCHNPDLAGGEGDMGYMIHRIHAGGDFTMLDGGISYVDITYPQDVTNCRKCHDGADPSTPDGANWIEVPNTEACFGCHVESNHPGGQPPPDNNLCTICHDMADIEEDHLTFNPTPNNPNVARGQIVIEYELLDARVDMATNAVTIDLRILGDGAPLDVSNLPMDLAGPGNYPRLVLAWALAQDGVMAPMDYNNLGRRAGQPISLSLNAFLAGGGPGTHAYDGVSGTNTFVVTDPASQFPAGATLRAVGLEGYFQQDIAGEIVSLHTPSAVVGVTGDDRRRVVVDNMKCAQCHEWFEGHGGNRTFNMEICTLCHVPNLSSTGRTVVDPTLRDLDDDLAAAIADGSLSADVDPNDPLTYPEDAQSFRDLVHAIHASDFRDSPFQHVRGGSRQGFYDWSGVTFPRGAETSNCTLCHDEGTFEFPLDEGLLPVTLRTTGVSDGQDPSVGAAEAAFVAVPNATDWVGSIAAGACAACHTTRAAAAHMEANGGQLSRPQDAGWWTSRDMLSASVEACAVCHGPGKISDVAEVHSR